ncbi:MAG: MFS family permease [Paraglaciecola psychrophila]
MRQTFRLFLSLFVSCFILLLGNGLINVLFAVRMDLDGFNTDTIGLVLSLYYVGMLLGALYSKTLIARAGHIRMFAGCVALAAVSILICSLFSDTVLWGAMRLLIGFCNACAFTAMESWLSDGSTKENRGKVLAVYNAVVLAGLFGGQFLMNVASPGDATLFVVAGILLCIAIVPMVLSNNSGPLIESVESMSLLKLYHVSPLGVVSCVASGLIYSALFNLLPVFAGNYDIVDFQLSLYVGAAILGAFLLQFPVGYLSDNYDRRSVLLVLLSISATVSCVIAALASAQFFSVLFVATAVSAGIVACIYPLSIAEVFDRLRQSEMVSAMSSMILAFSAGGILGPYSASIVMEYFGSDALFYYLAIIQLLLAAFVLYRMAARHALPVDEQESFVMQGAAITASVELDPRSEFVEQMQPLTSEAETAVSIAEFDPAAAVKMARAVALYDPALGVGVAAAVATVDGIDVLRLYEVMKEVLPGQISEVTQAIVTTRPELAYQLVSKLAEWYPEQVVDVAAEIGQAIPELRVAMARAAIAAAPESATQVAEYYASVLAQERDAVRPADRGDDNSEASATDIAAQLWRGSADQALDVAVAMADAMPTASVSLAQQYIASGAGNIVDDMSDSEMEEHLDKDLQRESEAVVVADAGLPLAAGPELAAAESADYVNTVELVSRLAEAAPEQALDMAVAVVEALPDSAAEVAAEMASTIDERSEHHQLEVTEEPAFDDAVKLVQRLTEASPEMAMDVAVAVVEELPDSAAEVAAQYAGAVADSESTTQSDNEEAVELLQRLSEAAPDSVMDVAVAVVEAIPTAASELVDAISEGAASVEGEWVNNMEEKPES